MRLLESPVRIERAMVDLPPAQVVGQAITPGASLGTDSASPFGFGSLLAEQNPDLTGPQRFFTYNTMRNEDAVVRSCLWMFKLVIRQADWSLEPASADPLDRAVRDAVAWCFGYEDEIGQMDQSADEQHSQHLLCVDFGSMFEELVWGDVEPWADADGDPHLIRPLARLAPRFPSTIRWPDGIRIDRRTGFIASLEQSTPGSRPIPGDKLSYYALEREGTDWYGRSLLRSMYGSWKLKRAVMISAGIGWDRYAFGTPVVRYPMGEGPAKKREAEAIGRNWRSHERGWVVLEGRNDQGWDVEIVGGQNTMGDPTPLLTLYNDEMRQAALQHFAGLGRTQSGSRALADVQVEPFYMASQAIADHVAMQKMRLPFRRFVDENFGTRVPVPRLNVSKITTRNVLNLAQAIESLSSAGLAFTDRDTQNDLRDALDLRHLPEDAQEAIDQLDNNVGIEAVPGGPTDPAVQGAIQARGANLAEGDDLGL